MAEKFDVISIGSATRDVFISSESLISVASPSAKTGKAFQLNLGSKFEVSKIVLSSGGGGTNAAVTFARQGLKTACIGIVGQDINGLDILNLLMQEGVDTRYFQKHDDDMTAYSIILVDPAGERTILSYKGEGQHFDISKIPFDELDSQWLFLDSLGGNFELLEKSVSWAKENGVKIASNPGGKELAHGLDKLRPILAEMDLVITNQEEASDLLSIPYTNENEIFKAMDDIVKGIFVMTKGPAGVAVSDGKEKYIASIPDSPVVERTGAGDAFSSGFVAEYIRSGDISKAIQFATANASSVVTKYGAKDGILRKGDWGPWKRVEVKKENL